MCALRRLMLDFDANAEYSFVARQVGKNVYEEVMTTAIDALSNALYFFEPNTKNTMSPMALGITPSLPTLSQCLDRIKEFTKRFYVESWRMCHCRCEMQSL
jgi:hypothetical protein